MLSRESPISTSGSFLFQILPKHMILRNFWKNWYYWIGYFEWWILYYIPNDNDATDRAIFNIIAKNKASTEIHNNALPAVKNNVPAVVNNNVLNRYWIIEPKKKKRIIKETEKIDVKLILMISKNIDQKNIKRD